MTYTLKQKQRYSKASRTKYERRLWPLRLVGFRSGRVVLGYCPDWASYRVLVEVDGGIHDKPYIKALDRRKKVHFTRQGYLVIRVSNGAVAAHRWRVMVGIAVRAVPFNVGSLIVYSVWWATHS